MIVIRGFQLPKHLWLRNSRRWMHTVRDEELTDYYDRLTRFYSRAYPLQNIAMCRMNGKGHPVILTDKWPNFSCTAIKINAPCFPSRSQWSSRLLLLSNTEEEFADFLHDSKVLQEQSLIAGIDSVTNRHLDNVAKFMFPKWQQTLEYPLKLYCLSGKVEDIPRLESDEYFIDKLTPDHAGFIGSYYKRINEDPAIVEKYFQYILIMYDTSAGIFKRSDLSYPIAWGVYGDLGKAIHLYSIPEHRGKGISSSVSRYLFTQLVQQAIIPVVDRSIDSEMSDSNLARHMLHYATDRAWRDSTTGKCCWLY